MRITRNVGYTSKASLSDPGSQRTAPQTLLADTLRMTAWALATTGGFITHFHHDSNGAATWATVSCGAKIWTILTPRSQDPDVLMRSLMLAAQIDHFADPTQLEEFFWVTSVVLERGSVL